MLSFSITQLIVFFTHSDSSVGKESACNAGDPSSTPGWGRSPRGGQGNPLQYSRLENPMDRGAWRAMTKGTQLSNKAHVHHLPSPHA